MSSKIDVSVAEDHSTGATKYLHNIPRGFGAILHDLIRIGQSDAVRRRTVLLRTHMEESILRESARNGAPFAMQRLGEYLLSKGDSKSAAEGEDWLRLASGTGSASAFYALGSRALDGLCASTSPQRGLELLKEAAACGHLQGTAELGIRLLCGVGTKANSAEGEVWLRRAADLHDQTSMILLGRWLISGRYLPSTLSEGELWLARAGVRRAIDGSRLGSHLYRHALNSTSSGISQLFMEEAAESLFQGHLFGDQIASVNLAYMIRRGEADALIYPNLDQLLAPGLRLRYAFAYINSALRLAAGVQCTVDWQAADLEMAQIATIGSALQWWSFLRELGDPEGELVVGWLVRHGKTVDPEGVVPRDRFARISESWLVPDWIS